MTVCCVRPDHTCYNGEWTAFSQLHPLFAFSLVFLVASEQSELGKFANVREETQCPEEELLCHKISGTFP